MSFKFKVISRSQDENGYFVVIEVGGPDAFGTLHKKVSQAEFDGFVIGQEFNFEVPTS